MTTASSVLVPLPNPDAQQVRARQTIHAANENTLSCQAAAAS